MSEYAPILKSHEWFIGEKKNFEFTVQGVSDITSWDIIWKLKPSAGSDTVYILKLSTAAEIQKAGAKATVLIKPTDYGAVPGGGTYDHALMRVDGDNDAVLAFGEAVLQEAATP